MSDHANSNVPADAFDMRPDDDAFHEAVEALRAIGRKVEPTGDDLGLWLVDDRECTDGELIALAHVVGLVAGPERAQ